MMTSEERKKTYDLISFMERQGLENESLVYFGDQLGEEGNDFSGEATGCDAKR